jgi:hypothetical protein
MTLRVGQPGYGVDPKDLKPKTKAVDKNTLPNKPSWTTFLDPKRQKVKPPRTIQPDTESGEPAPKAPRKRVISVKDL